MKPKELIKFAENNAREILGKDPLKQDYLMEYPQTCVLRPWLMPQDLRKKLTNDEWLQYRDASINFKTAQDIPVALRWIKKWVNRK